MDRHTEKRQVLSGTVLVTFTGPVSAGKQFATQVTFAMTRIEFTPAFLTLETEPMASMPARKPEESVGKDGFAEVFAGIQVQGGQPVAQAVTDAIPGEAMVSLRRVELSPSMQLIMPASPAPDATSLHAFARMQGLDENAIAQLFGADAALTDPVLPAPPLPDPAATLLSEPFMAGFEPGGLAAWMGRAPDSEPDVALPPAGNMLSIGIQKLLQPVSPQAVQMTSGPTVAQETGPEVEIIPLELTVTESSIDSPDVSPVAQPFSTGPAVATGAPATLGTWEEMGLIAAKDVLAGSSVGALTKVLHGQAMKAADLASLSTLAVEDVMTQIEGALDVQGADTSGAGNTGNTATGGGWTAGQQTPSTQQLAMGDGLETGDVATSRQLGEQLTQRMGEQIAQRIMNKLAQGEWQFKFVINPKHLGEIQVNLRMHAGGLDGAFIANQSATREMLGEGLQRLREALTGFGMNVASLDVGADHSSRQGRQSMTSGQTASALAPQGLQQSAQETMTARQVDSRGGDLGWDVLV